ncbi:MAG TPA: hypothetical protein VK524_01785 [Polyangiaceae bacterium]|nr:hypothetical protein [Polyangiaceae bacterium]
MSTLELVLLHSPIVGSDFWRPLAQVLESRGQRCSLPTAVARDRELVAWRDWPSVASAELNVAPGAIVVGHSAAGFLLPSLASALDASGVIFVDALIPPASGSVPPADSEFLQFVHRLPCDDDGLLPPWSRWWGDGAIERLIADPQAYARFEANLPRLPPSWVDDKVDIPSWHHLLAGYLQTSARFAPSASDAQQRGWPVRTLTGTHLHPMIAPGETADALLELVASITSS